MESDEEHRTFHGMYPECGAIFMSSSSTKNECFRRRLFGLPSGQGQFVKQVKTGMILFLFEFEKRELHGVFQACSDGTMNIVPRAWSTSGKQFSAQVKVNPIWRCHPLSESEFADAIKENYFSKWKFNFGLSEAQVWRLLMLFSLRQVRGQHPQRALARNTDAKPVDTKDIDEKLDDGSWASDKVGNLHKLDNNLGSIIRRGYLEHLPGKVGRDDTKYAICERAGNGVNMDVEHRVLTSTEHARWGQNGRGDGNLAMCGREGSVSCLDAPFYSGMPLQQTYSLFQDQRRLASTCSHQMELPIPSHSYTASPGNAIIMSTLPYDPDYPGLNLPHLRSVGGNDNFDSVQDCDGQNGIPSLRNQVHPLYTEANGLNQNLDDISKVDVRRSLSAINCTPLPRAASSAEMAIDYSKSSLAPESLSEIGRNGRDTERPSSYLLSPSNYPSFVVYRDHPVAVQNKPEHEIAPFTANVISSEEIQYQLPCHTHSGDHESMDYHERKCFDHKISERMLCSDLLENRSSVFSRLSLNTPGWSLKNLGHEESVKDTSVDEVMAMLGESHYPWMESKKSRPCKRREGDVENYKNIKQTAVQSDLEMIPEKSNTTYASPTEDKDVQRSKKTPFVDFKRRSELRKVNRDTNGESVGREGLLGGRCKRKKLIRPNFSENEPRCSINEDVGGSCESSVGSQGQLLSQDAESSHENEKINTESFSKYEREMIVDISGGSPKIGDNGRKECLHDNKTYPGNSCLNLQVSVNESSICEDANCEKLVGPNFRENELFQVSPHECSSGEDAGESYEALVGSQGNIDAQRFPISEIEVNLESSGESLKIGDECGKKPVHDVGSQVAIFPDKNDIHNAQDSDHEDPMVLSQDCHETSQSTVLESALQPQTNAGTRIGFFEIESDRGSELEVLPRFELSPNIDGRGGSSKRNSKSPIVAENVSNRADMGMANYQQGFSTEQLQASCNSNEHESPQLKGSRNNLLEAGDNDASDYTIREREVEIKLESFVGSVKSGDECGMEPVEVVGKDILGASEDSDHKEPIVNRLSQECPETIQSAVLEFVEPKTNSGTRNGGDRCTELEVLPRVEVCPNINLSNPADASMVNNQHGFSSSQSQASCNSNKRKSPQEHRSSDNVPETVELGDNDAIDDTVKENKRLWRILTARLQLLKNAQ